MKTISIVVLLAIISLSARALMLGDAEKGRIAHDSKCVACHTAQFGGDGSGIYLRTQRRVKSAEGLIKQVEFCNRQTGAGFSEEQINDVIKYLNESFYRFE